MSSPTSGPDLTIDDVPTAGASDYLRSVLATVHQSESNSVALTLAIPAGVVHGHAVHPAVWLRRMAAQVRTRPGPRAGKENVARIFEAHASRRDDADLTVNALTASINHVYLVDATLAPAGSAAQAPGTLWQVSIADVSAWTVGSPGPA